MKYRVSLAGTAIVSGGVTVHANSEAEAKDKALEIADHGDITWDYEGLVDGAPIEVDGIRGE